MFAVKASLARHISRRLSTGLRTLCTLSSIRPPDHPYTAWVHHSPYPLLLLSAYLAHNIAIHTPYTSRHVTTNNSSPHPFRPLPIYKRLKHIPIHLQTPHNILFSLPILIVVPCLRLTRQRTKLCFQSCLRIIDRHLTQSTRPSASPHPTRSYSETRVPRRTRRMREVVSIAVARAELLNEPAFRRAVIQGILFIGGALAGDVASQFDAASA